MTTIRKQEIRLLLDTVEHDFGDGRPTLRFQLMPVTVEDGYLRNPSYGSELDSLRITAQLDYVAEQPYGWRVEYRDVYSLELEGAEQIVRMLRKVRRGLERIEADYGYPETFAAYVTRVGKVLGVTAYGWRSERSITGGPQWQYAETAVRWTDANGITSRLATLAADFKREQEPRKVE